MTRSILVLIALATIAQPCRADIVQDDGAATLVIVFGAEQPTIALSDLITVTLQVEGSKALRVHAPLDLPTGSKWTLMERSKPERRPDGPDRVRWRLVYRFAPQEPGDVPFLFPDVKFRDVDEQDQTSTWKVVTFKVTTQVTKLDRGSLRGVPDIETVPTPAAADLTWPKWTALGAASCLLAVGWFASRRWFRRGIPKSPAQWAQRELDRLIALKLPEQGRSERFVTLLSLLVRRYLERQHQLLARRQTTPEFLRQLEQQPDLSADEKQFLGSFLTRCDTVKYAGVEMPTDECRQWAESTRRVLIRRCSQAAQAGGNVPVEKFGQTG